MVRFWFLFAIIYKINFSHALNLDDWEVRKCHGAKEKIAQIISSHLCFNVPSTLYGMGHKQDCRLYNPKTLLNDLIAAGLVNKNLKRSRCIDKAFDQLKKESYFGDYELETFEAVVMQDHEKLTIQRLQLTQRLITNRTRLLGLKQIPKAVIDNLSKGFSKKLPGIGRVNVDEYMMTFYDRVQIEELGVLYDDFEYVFNSDSGFIRIFDDINYEFIQEQYHKEALRLVALLTQLGNKSKLISQRESRFNVLSKEMNEIENSDRFDAKTKELEKKSRSIKMEQIELELDILKQEKVKIIADYETSLGLVEDFYTKHTEAHGLTGVGYSRNEIITAISDFHLAMDKLKNKDFINSQIVHGDDQLLYQVLHAELSKNRIIKRLNEVNSSEVKVEELLKPDDLKKIVESFYLLSAPTLDAEVNEVKESLENLIVAFEKSRVSEFYLRLEDLKINKPDAQMGQTDYMLLMMQYGMPLTDLISNQSVSKGRDFKLDPGQRENFALVHYKTQLKNIQYHSDSFNFVPPFEDVLLAGLLTNRITDDEILEHLANDKIFPQKDTPFKKFINTALPFAGALSVINPVASTLFLIGSVTWSTVNNLKNEKRRKNAEEDYFCIYNL